ncbi:MAG TPA: ATPase, T2SS/T4P/T4SS family, partial [Longimicrobiales bacterium]
MTAQHWLVTAVRRGGMSLDDGLLVPPATPLAEAWAAVAVAGGSTDRTVCEAVARAFHIRPADLAASDQRARRLVPGEVARRFVVYPLREDNYHLWVATAEPVNVDAEQALGFCSGRTPVFEVAPPAALRAAVDGAYAPERAVESFLRTTEIAGDGVEGVHLLEADEQDDQLLAEDLGAGPVVRLANLVLRDAIEHRASDIHIQPTPSGGVVRFRVDGVLRTVLQFPIAVLLRVVSRFKVMGKLDIADRLRPQDGRFRVSVQGRPYDFRLSTVPVRGAEKAVIRILDTGGSRNLDELHMTDHEEGRFRHLLMAREGILAVTGPTGSGKTTTLYAALKEIATEGVNIMTVEDPVEYELPGIAQIQVETKQNVTFASALRAILRQDPDVIFVG